ncbi:MAG: NeuD/PglB/VioB family sugar acetyltransferase [Candidatus Wallbacteria bacterium]|nr:NeuD/PglB/VioB family sugar acetyltransferase [Candidatus Wallbacteria bacterium]
MNFIFGAAGFAREVEWMARDIYSDSKDDYRPDYFVCDDKNTLAGEKIKGISVINESEFFKKHSTTNNNCFIAIGSPTIKNAIYEKIVAQAAPQNFPNLIHPSVCYDRDFVAMGHGNIICANSILTTDIKVGNFVHLNLACTVGHDSIIGDYTTTSPGVLISGNVKIDKLVFIGSGAVIFPNLSISTEIMIGASALVTKDLLEKGTYVGCPVKKVK